MLTLILATATWVALSDGGVLGFQPLLRVGRGGLAVVPTRWDYPRRVRGPRVVANHERARRA